MDLGQALEIVFALAKQHWARGELGAPAKCPADVVEALNMVEDFIVNEFGED